MPLDKTIIQQLRNNSITILDLSYKQIGDEEAKKLAKALKDNKSITTLQLNHNQIGDAGAKGLAKSLKYNNSITTLDLHKNRIGAAGAESLAECLKANKSITTLDLHDNHIGDAGAKELAETLKINTTLTSLDLSGNGIGVEGAKKIDTNLKADIETKLQRNKEIKDVSESFKAIISKITLKITLGTDGTPLLSWDKEGSDQNSVFNELKRVQWEIWGIPYNSIRTDYCPIYLVISSINHTN